MVYEMILKIPARTLKNSGSTWPERKGCPARHWPGVSIDEMAQVWHRPHVHLLVPLPFTSDVVKRSDFRRCLLRAQLELVQ